jgi:hypothetical protein
VDLGLAIRVGGGGGGGGQEKNRVRHEPDPIINRVELQNPNTTHFTFVLPEHDPGNTIH